MMLVRTLALAALLFACPFATAQVAMMPPQTGTFSGNTRGYWFTAPSDMMITGINVLPQTGSAAAIQNFAIVHFDGNVPPPTFSTTTNAFVQMALGLDQPGGAGVFSAVNVLVSAGDVIGIYGNTMNAAGAATGLASYGSGAVGTTISGVPVVLNRSGMQFSLGSATSPAGMHDLWQEPASVNITRIDFTFAPVPEPSSLMLLGMGAIWGLSRRARSVVCTLCRRS